MKTDALPAPKLSRSACGVQGRGPWVPLRKGDLGGWKPDGKPPHKKNPRFGQPRIRDIEEI
ncbi:hypothetical protein ET33_21775 [Paenibacillus tyrfis]|uniref:Uncharacterized protein n=1 Tax=Paenibacillus tyrfis TaxID=1501230 RepID=A0A081NWC8_9BACL|nr:hypothetical protein ET33_21775 [Paenibacillus tyrfis]